MVEAYLALAHDLRVWRTLDVASVSGVPDGHTVLAAPQD
jgi:hypothetical protein